MGAKFIDRLTELTALQEQYDRRDASFVVVYGRRRVGKTTLLTHFMEGKRALYFLATEESEAQNLDAFRLAAADFLGDSLLAAANLDRWEPVFDRLADAASPDSPRLLIVIDEFQYLGKANPAFPSIFQKIWDTSLSRRNVMVVVCGSLISLMASQVLAENSPLYGRRTAQIRLQQIPFSCYHEFFGHPLGRRELIERYAVTGGVPKYIEVFEGEGDLLGLIERNVFNKNSFLFDEPNFLLSKEVAEVGSYFSIIKAIACGSHKLSDIASRLGVKATSLSRYLRVLEGLDILRREVPVTEPDPSKSKKGLYFLKDNYLRFWFRFAFPWMGLLETGHTEAVMEKVRVSFTDGLASFVYEDICREEVWELAANERFPFIPNRVGRWWSGKDAEIDVVAVNDEEGRIAFGECKFWKGPVGLNVLAELEQKAAFVPWRQTGRREDFVLFSIGGFTEELRAVAAERPDVWLFS